MNDYVDYRVSLMKGNIHIDVYVSFPADELVLVERNGFRDLHSDSFDKVVDHAAQHLKDEIGADLWVSNWDYEIEELE